MRLIPNFDADLRPRRLLGTAILSGSALLLEIALTRLFSLIFFPPYVFFIISIAILGIGIGAAATALRPALARENGPALYSGAAAFFTLLLLLFTAVGGAPNLQILLFILTTFPYVCFGLAISSLFAQHPPSSRVLYMSDLVGAGCGALLAIPLLTRFGAVNSLLIAAAGFSAAGLYLVSQRYRLLVMLCISISTVVFVTNAAANFLAIDPSRLAVEKPIVKALSGGGRILRTHWDAFARTDLVDPGDGGPLRIYVDGGAASAVPTGRSKQEFIQDIGFFPFATGQPERVFIIGPGGGLDVWFALQSGARQITAVEVNAASVDLVNAWSAYSGGIYQEASVEVVIDDGRSALGRATDKFDLIFLSQVVTLAAERGGYALSENAIYTEEAFVDYLAHLDDEGQIALKLYDEVTLTRALSTALAALRRRGMDDRQAMKHLMAFVDDRSDPPVPLLLISASAYREDDSLALGAIARDVGFTPLLLPHVLVQPPLDAVDQGDESFAAIIAASDVDISPPTDDRPYFFQFERGIPVSLVPLSLVSALVTAVLLMALTLWRRGRSGAITIGYPAFFALLGVGFIAVEIFAIQQTRLFLGHPTIAVTLVLATFLVGGGIGSGLSQRVFRNALDRRPQMAPAMVVVTLILWSLLWSPLSQELLAADFLWRGSVVILSLLPLALCMGAPFPMALETVGREDRSQVALAWCVNGLMTVVGSVVAVVLSLTIGFNAVLCFGAAAYLLATIILSALRRGERS